jgi:outer membrane protein TolC
LQSLSETARITHHAPPSVFPPPSAAALSRASDAKSNAAATQRRTACELGIKALVALSGIDEPGLRRALQPGAAQLPQPRGIAVAAVPAQALAQRPDLYAAGRELLAASADVDQAEARRYPRITLAGSIGAARFDTGGSSLDGAVWTIGPVAVTLPLFDAGTRRANVDAARARYDEAAALYAARLRTAVREVEEALVTLDGTAQRGGDAETAVDGFVASLRATEARYNGGLASLFELEDARRSAVQAQMALIDLRRERVQAWIALYRALGGGWNADAPTASAYGSAPFPATAATASSSTACPAP